MITGFNPADMYAADHIKRVLQTFPGVFSGIGEFTIHKEFVSAKIAGETASLTNPALDRILDFAGEVGLVVILHNDVDMPFPKPGQDPYQVAAAAGTCSSATRRRRSSGPTAGSGASSTRSRTRSGSSSARSRTPSSRTSTFDISWDETAKYLVATPETTQAAADLINRHPDRFLFGTDEVAPTEQAKYLKVYDLYAPLFAKLTPEASEKLRKGNYERLFDEARREGPGVGEGEPEVSEGGNREKDTHRVAAARGRAAGAGGGGRRSRRPRAGADAHARGRRRTGPPRPRPRPSLAWTSTASPCSTWATSRARTTRTGSTCCGRPSCPSYENEYGEDGHFFAGVRQSRLGVKGFIPTDVGEIKTIFEFELFGTGVDAGQTTFRLRHAWGELGQFGAGQTWSPFMDPDVFPNSVEYWGPNGMVFFRNVQVRWTPWQDGDSRFAVALERPGASADQGVYAGRIELEGVTARFPLPDLSAQFRYAKGWGHVQVAGILRQMKWDDTNDDQFDLTGDATGWGINLSTNLKLSRHVFRGSVAFGEGVQNYWNDAPVDVGIQNNFSNPRTPIVGEALPILGHRGVPRPQLERRSGRARSATRWWTSTTATAQTDAAFKRGQYALANVLYHPTPDVFLGPEIQWGKRENFRDGFTSDDVRIQFSAKYNFKLSLGGK